MSGLAGLSEQEIAEMQLDARSPERRAAFAAARQASQTGSLDDYIDFLSANMASVPRGRPRVHITIDYRL
jgi:hypothetical protein